MNRAVPTDMSGGYDSARASNLMQTGPPTPVPGVPSRDRSPSPIHPPLPHGRVQQEAPFRAGTDVSPTGLPELVRDTRLEARVLGNTTIHRRTVRRRGAPEEESWIRKDNNLLGHGGGGLVWLEHKRAAHGDMDTKELRAVKAIRLSGRNAVSEGQQYRRELEALAKFSQDRYSEFFVRFAGWYEITNYLCIAMEYCEHGDLKHHLQTVERLLEDEAQDIASQVLGALVMMHEEGFAHRDVKPANILIKSKPPEGWWVKVCDLGLSKRAEDMTGATTVRGTPGFWAPETLGFNQNAPLLDARPTDMWCFGETVFQMLTGHPTFDSVADLYRYQAGLMVFPLEALDDAQVHPRAMHFIGGLMAADPSERPTAQVAQGHDWMRMHRAVARHRHVETITIGLAEVSQASWPPQLPSEAPGQFTQASAEWTKTMVMRDQVSTNTAHQPAATSLRLPSSQGTGSSASASVATKSSPTSYNQTGRQVTVDLPRAQRQEPQQRSWAAVAGWAADVSAEPVVHEAPDDQEQVQGFSVKKSKKDKRRRKRLKAPSPSADVSSHVQGLVGYSDTVAELL